MRRVITAWNVAVAISLFALQLTTVDAYAQQVADPQFNASVAKPAYVDKHPQVLLDEAHRNVHTANGRYKPFVNLIRNDGYRVTANREMFTKKRLDGFDILVIANAAVARGGESSESAFTIAECDAVHDWVQSGGALLLIADHAPYGAAAETLAKRFGVKMSKGFTLDEANMDKSRKPGWLLFSKENKLLGDHPITQGRDETEKVKRVVSFMGQSLKGPEGSVALLKLSDSATELPSRGSKKSVSVAGHCQGLAFPYGKGRVVVMGEAAMLSAQVIQEPGKEPHTPHGMNFPGTDNRQLALNLMHWLSGLLEQ